MKLLSRVQLFVIPWTVAYQAPLSMEFSRQEYWSGLPFPSPGDLPDPGIEPRSPALQADALLPELPGKPILCYIKLMNLYLILKNILKDIKSINDFRSELGRGNKEALLPMVLKSK